MGGFTGDSGDDVLIGDDGDVMSGGAGQDAFQVALHAYDVDPVEITDFVLSAEGQAILADLGGAILRQAAWAAGAQPADIATSTPGADIAQMNHETLEVRIFRS